MAHCVPQFPWPPLSELSGSSNENGHLTLLGCTEVEGRKSLFLPAQEISKTFDAQKYLLCNLEVLNIP